jgi:hypothetical protein
LSQPGIEAAATSSLNLEPRLGMTNKTHVRQNYRDTSSTHLKATVLPMDVNVYIVKKASLASGQEPTHPKIGTVSGAQSMEFNIARLAVR